MNVSVRPFLAVAAVAASTSLLLTACGRAEQPAGPSHAARGTGGFTVGVLMPDDNVTRYQHFDKPLIEKRIRELCGACTVVEANAQGDARTQRQQLTGMLINGARVLILDPVDRAAVRLSVQQAHDAGVPVISYDRLADGPVSGYVTYDDYAIGRLQGQALLRGMGERARGGRVVWLDSTTRPTTALPSRRLGAMSVLGGKVRIDTQHALTIPVPNVQDAYAAMAAAIATYGPDRIDGVYAVDDVVAAGAVSALKAARVTPLPPVVGQDAELSAVRRILSGEQYMTVYKPYGPEADAAARMAVALGRGGKSDPIATHRVSTSTTKDIPAVSLTPVPVTAGDIKGTVVHDGMYTVKEICAPALTAACRKAGLT
ncbi:substrate-binding domain-containing protein [Streptomyces sp. NPDC018347]|uniref:substrate-binding domain-containing protein n=1 Tax=Streptomyces sp. NPDC018347 TaxID=3157193 RepID=UPI0033FCCE84